MNPHDAHFRTFMLAVAACASALVILLLYAEGISQGGLLLVLATYGLWWLATPIATRADAVPAPTITHSPVNPAMGEVPPQTSDLFYGRLFANLEFGWARFQHDHAHALRALHNVERSLDKASDMALSTGLLATNAMISAAQSGEVGRGFVNVSRDLISISDQSQQDLERLRRLVHGFTSELSRCQPLVEQPVEFWLVSSAGLPVTALARLQAEVIYAQQQVKAMGERYRRTTQADVRWLQLGDAVKRLFNELINTLYQLELHLQDVLSDMRLLRLNQGMPRQIVEIKDRMQINKDDGGVSQKFMF